MMTCTCSAIYGAAAVSTYGVDLCEYCAMNLWAVGVEKQLAALEGRKDITTEGINEEIGRQVADAVEEQEFVTEKDMERAIEDKMSDMPDFDDFVEKSDLPDFDDYVERDDLDTAIDERLESVLEDKDVVQSVAASAVAAAMKRADGFATKAQADKLVAEVAGLKTLEDTLMAQANRPVVVESTLPFGARLRVLFTGKVSA